MVAVCTSPATEQEFNETRCATASRVAVLGAGAWGTALGAALQRSGSEVMLWTRRPELAHALRTTHQNPRHLPGLTLPPGLRATTDMAEALSGAQMVLLALPSAALREAALRAAPFLPRATVVLAACKGFEQGSGALPTTVLRECCDASILPGVLSGPSFAAEVARGLPTRLTLALPALAPLALLDRPSQRPLAQLDGTVNSNGPGSATQAHRAHAFAMRLRQQLAQASITLELTDDAVAAQVGGAMKNLVAIACGMATAQGLGENARAAIVTLGLDDMRRLTLELGGRSQTLLGSCGVGDLFLTAASTHSRNTRLGLHLGSAAANDASCSNPGSATHELAEGAVAALSVQALEHRLGLRLHVAACVREVLLRQRSAAQALAQLLRHGPVQNLPTTWGAVPAPRDGHRSRVARTPASRSSQRPTH